MPTAKENIEQIRSEKRKADSPDLRAALKLLAEELNTKETHFILEILQNAEDNEYSGTPELSLNIEVGNPTNTPSADGCLVVLNNEVGFQLENVRSLSSVGQSTKKDKSQGYIGEKGIGFKSVFRVTDSPHIFSNGFQFRFHIPTEAEGFGYILPHWVEALPSLVKKGVTAILLPLQPGKKALVAKQLSKIAPESILFLQKLKRLEVGEGRSILRTDGGGSLVTLCGNGDDSLYFVHSEKIEKPKNVSEEKRQGIKWREVTVAFPLMSSAPCKGRIYAFLPTEFDSGLPFLVNADFVLNSNRERVLEDRHWNQWLRDEIAPTFVKAFLSVLNEPQWKVDVYRFLPLASDLTPGAEFFAAIVGPIQSLLQVEQCVLTKTGDYVLPKQAHFASPLANRVLRDAPPERATMALLHPDLECHWERLKPLGVQLLTFAQLFDACNDDAWLKSRDAEWWETLFQLCADRPVPLTAEIIGSFPILRCRDGNCRPLSCRVFFHAEGQPVPTGIPSDWPAAHLLDADLQMRLQQKPTWAWLTRVAGLRPFSVQAYITGSLLDWMREQTGEHAAERLVEATRFIAANLKQPDEHRQTLREKMPWLLADKRVLLPEARAGKELVTPECMEGEAGWNRVFDSGSDRQHFWVLHDAYVEGQADDAKDAVRKLMVACGATDVPDPVKLRRPNGQVDWGCPHWLRDLTGEQSPQDIECKITALERWIGRFKPDAFAKLLTREGEENAWAPVSANGHSELGLALRTRRWMRSTKRRLVVPTVGYADTQEIRDFLQGSVPYVQTKLAFELLEKLGVHLRLSANSLLDLLRQMRDSKEVDEALVVRIYRRLQTMEFDREVFRTERLVFLAKPTEPWMTTERVFWNDAGDVFDEEFGYAELTYKNEELHGFFANKLGIQDTPDERQFAGVWARMADPNPVAADKVEKRLAKILPKLAEAVDVENPADWWLQQRRSIKIWTTARQFADPETVFTPDDTFAEELFAQAAKIAWVPETHLITRVNRLLRSLGCRSLAMHLKSRPAAAAGKTLVSKPRFLTPASKQLVVCWACDSGDWSKKKQELELLLSTDETDVTELVVEYRLDGTDVPKTNRDANAFWDCNDRRLYLRHSATPKAQQSAVAATIAAQLKRTSKQAADTVYRLLGLEPSDATREMAERKWVLSPAQREWLRSLLHSLGMELIVLKIAPVEGESAPRDPRPATASLSGNSGQAGTSQQPNDDIASSESTEPQTDQTNAAQQVQEATGAHQKKMDSKEECSKPALKSADADVEVNVAAYTRRSPCREREQREPAGRRAEDQHPLAGVSQATKADIEEAAVRVVMRQFETRPDLRTFNKPIDRRKENKGYDVYAAKPGQVLRIEIKAHLRESKSVFVTQNEWKDSRRSTKDDRWELWNVENLAVDAGKVRITRYSNLPPEAFRESGYWVDLSTCTSESIQ